MKLYYSPASCAMSAHIALEEARLPHQLEKVDLKTKVTETGIDYFRIHAQGAVPFLILDDGEGLSEAAVILQYIADQNPTAGLLPPVGSRDRLRVQEWLNYIATEMHKAHVPLFKAEYPDATKQLARAAIARAYDHVCAQLGDRAYLVADQFSVADAYLFTVVNWHQMVNIDLAKWPVLVAYQARIAARPAVEAAMQKEGLQTRAA